MTVRSPAAAETSRNDGHNTNGCRIGELRQARGKLLPVGFKVTSIDKPGGRLRLVDSLPERETADVREEEAAALLQKNAYEPPESGLKEKDALHVRWNAPRVYPQQVKTSDRLK